MASSFSEKADNKLSEMDASSGKQLDSKMQYEHHLDSKTRMMTTGDDNNSNNHNNDINQYNQDYHNNLSQQDSDDAMEAAPPDHKGNDDDDQALQKEEIKSSPAQGDTSFPEGGFGWLVVLAAFVANFMTFGVNQTYGVYQNQFLSVHAFENATETSISWVGSIAAGVLFIPGPFTLPLIRIFTLRIMVLVGIVLASSGFLLASCATRLWHLYLTQGFLFGWGGGMVFFATISLPPQYFEKRRGLATGLSVSGAGIGGLVWAPVTEWLIQKVGIHWCQRVVGLVILGTLLAMLPFIRPRARMSTGMEATRGQGWAGVIEWRLFKIRGFVWLVMVAFILPFGYVAPVFLIPTYSRVILGQPATVGANLVGIFSGVNAAARVIKGMIGDRLGKTNTLFASCVMASMACLILWTLASRSLAILTAFMVVYAIVRGAFVSLLPAAAAQVVGMNNLPAALGILYCVQVFGNILGSPIATTILRWQQGKYEGTILFAGITPLVGAFFVALVRFQLNGKVFAIA